MRDGDLTALMQAEPFPREVRKTSLTLAHHVRGNLIEIGDDGSIIMSDLYPRMRFKPFRLADLAILMKVDLSFLNRLDSESSRFQQSRRRLDRSLTVILCGAVHDQTKDE